MGLVNTGINYPASSGSGVFKPTASSGTIRQSLDAGVSFSIVPKKNCAIKLTGLVFTFTSAKYVTVSGSNYGDIITNKPLNSQNTAFTNGFSIAGGVSGTNAELLAGTLPSIQFDIDEVVTITCISGSSSALIYSYQEGSFI